MTSINKISAALVFICLALPLSSAATVLYLDPENGSFKFDKDFIVSVMIDTNGRCINAAKVDLAFDKNMLNIVDFTKGGSIISLWTQNPDDAAISAANESGILTFSGGIPGGYCGKIPNDSARTNILGGIVFRTKDSNNHAGEDGAASTTINILGGSEIYLHDGTGNKDDLQTKAAQYVFSNSAAAAADTWHEMVKNDTTPPEQFKITIGNDPRIFDGKYFIIFNATDKQTGIDHYEVSELPVSGGKKAAVEPNAASPYLLKDQGLNSKIIVKAVDKAGNEATNQIIPGEDKPAFALFNLIYLAVAALIGLLLVKKLKNKYGKHGA